MRKILSLFSIALLLVVFLLPGCATINKSQKTAVLGSAAGSAIGAMIGKRAGNTAVGATIGAVIGASTGAYIGRKLDILSGHKNRTNPPLFVINGHTFVGDEARQMLEKIQSENVESVIVLKTEDAVARYGDKGENGAVIVSVKDI